MRADDHDALFARLARSAFRSRFKLGARERALMTRYGGAGITRHAEDFIRDRLAPARPANDGRQTPMRNHPVFVAQHATATCCRGCLATWHDIAAGRVLDDHEQHYVRDVILAWLARQTDDAARPASADD